jgi:N-acetylmuramoyl-L-alanine amidase
MTRDLYEKNFTLALARRLQSELRNRGLAALVLRDGDGAVSLERRAAIVNALRPAMFVSLHAAASAPALRVYTALLAAPKPAPSVFLPWESAQAPYLQRSRLLASAIGDELTQGELAVQTMAAALPPLNAVTTAAVAVEVSSDEPARFTSAEFQQWLATSLAAGLSKARGKIEEK